MSEERDKLERLKALTTPRAGVEPLLDKTRAEDIRAVLSALEAAQQRIAELERRVAKQDGLIPALKADSKQMNVNAVAYQAERERAEKAEAENEALRAKVERLREDRARCRECRERDAAALASAQFHADVAEGKAILRALASGEESRAEEVKP